MKRIISLMLIMSFVGCAPIIPKYIKDENPYKKRYYVEFDRAVQVTTSILEETKWKVTGTANPSVFEKSREVNDQVGKQVLIFAQNKRFLRSDNKRLNVFLRSGADPKTTEIEIRYLKTSSAVFKRFFKYSNDSLVDDIFSRLEEQF